VAEKLPLIRHPGFWNRVLFLPASLAIVIPIVLAAYAIFGAEKPTGLRPFVIGGAITWGALSIPWLFDLLRFLRKRPSPEEEAAHLLEASKEWSKRQAAFWQSSFARRLRSVLLAPYGLAGGDPAAMQLLSRQLDREAKDTPPNESDAP
jgi:hypothetical protein